MTDKRDKLSELPVSPQETVGEAHPSFEDFVRNQYRALVGFLRRRNGPEDAEEIAQESIISLLGYREKGKVSDWQPLLYRIAINHAIKRARREATHRHDGLGIEADQVASDMPMPDEEAERAQRAERLQSAILALPPKCRRVYLLRHGHDLSHAQIAKRCGISTKMVEKHLATAVLHLQRRVWVMREGGL